MREFSPDATAADKFRKIMTRGVSTVSVSTVQPPIDARERERMREFRTMLILSMVVALYFIGWSPVLIFFISLKLKFVPNTMYLLAAVLNFLNPTLNPLIYALNIKERKMAAKILIKKIFFFIK